MRIDLPICGFTDCRHNFDCNCSSKQLYYNCYFHTLKFVVYECKKILDEQEINDTNRELKELIELAL